jgi:hypothetical protein
MTRRWARQFWERNLRLKTDASDDGPEKNAPALVDAGMMGDRADVIFADPAKSAPSLPPNAERTERSSHANATVGRNGHCAIDERERDGY